MDVFHLHVQVIGDYAEFTRSFVDIRDKRIAEAINDAIDDGMLWPDPWIQLNPNFAPGALTDALVEAGVLHPALAGILRRDKSRDGGGLPLRFHKHQVDAIDAARRGDNYVLTTGTGSGKSLAYLAPIVDRVMREGAARDCGRSSSTP